MAGLLLCVGKMLFLYMFFYQFIFPGVIFRARNWHLLAFARVASGLQSLISRHFFINQNLREVGLEWYRYQILFQMYKQK